ncbi:MAG: DUF4129 domain-containing transglutaminase family protein [Xenococcus sp. (in: cyanobacteria)]
MPRFIIGISIIFWGWQTGLWFVALPMALIYEASYFLRWRWELSTKEFMEVGKFCGLLMIGVLLYLIVANPSVYWIFEFFQWFPVVFFPFLTAQAYSTSDLIDIRMFFYFLRNRKPIAINLTYPFFALCIIAASAGNSRGMTLYLGIFLLSAIALWFQRSNRFSPQVWICLIILAGGMGILGHLALHRLHRIVEYQTGQFFSGLYHHHHHHHHHHYNDPTETTTTIGDIGSVKLTNKILFRVKPQPEALPTILRESLLLRRVSHNKYRSGTWIGLNSEFVPVKSTSDKTNWYLATTTDNITPNLATVTITTRLKQEQSFLNLPQGTTKIRQLPGELMSKNQYATVKLEAKPGLVSYQVQYNREFALDSPPTKEDLQIPPREKSAINFIVEELDLQGKSATEILAAVNKFFNTEFTYTLDWKPPVAKSSNSTRLAAFLLDYRSGHCEYFATAAALLLRDLGIPTRYIIGYSVHEYSSWENQFIVRERNAHAWTLVYIDGVWQEFDPTPSAWVAIEDANSSQLTFIQDLWSWTRFKLAVLIQQMKSGEAAYLYWLLIIPLGFILLRQFNSRQGIKRVDLNKNIVQDIRLGTDSEIYLIETALKELGISRYPTETWYDWLARLQEDQQTPSDLISDLQVIVQLHYRYRFDPQGISELERNQLQSVTRAWLARYQKWREKVES